MSLKMLRILIVEDMPHYRDICLRMLEEANLFQTEVVAVDHLADAFEAGSREPFDVVLLDLDLPDSTGVQTARDFCARFPYLPVIVVSGSYQEDSLMTALQIGAQDYLVKGQFDKHLLHKSILYAVERHNMKEALREKQQLMEKLLESIPSPVFFKDAQGRYMACNQAFSDYIGLPKKDIIGHTAFEQAPRDLAEIYEQKDRELIQRLGTQSYEGDVVWADGTRHNVIFYKALILDQQSNPNGIVGVMLDITDRKKAEEQLQHSRQRFRAIFEASPDAMIISDAETGQVIDANPAFEVLTGYSVEELLFQDIDSFGIFPGFPTRMSAIHASGEGVQCRNEERPLLRHDGNRLSILCSRELLTIEERSHILTIARDITEMKALEIELQHAHRMESIGRLAAGIAHEINTPIQYVNDNLEFLQETFTELLEGMETPDAADDDGGKEELDLEYLREEVPLAFRQALEGVSRVSDIVRAMKSFAHPGVEEKQSIDLNSVIESTITVARNEWKYVAEVETTFCDELPPVQCYPGDIPQTLLNLLVNAAHAIGDKVKGTEDKGLIHISTLLEGNKAVILVRDSGTGIPQSAQPHVFEPFFTTKQVGVGTGQGLAISYNAIVKKHHGELTFETREGEGTTFRIVLPLMD